MSPEPEIVTLSKMSGHLAGRLADVETALAQATSEVAAESLLAERGGSDDALRKLASAEKRKDKLTAERERLRVAAGELERQLTAEREKAEADRRRDMLDEYEGHRDAVEGAARQLFEAIVSLEPLVLSARQREKAARALAAALGLPMAGGGRYYPQLVASRDAFRVILGDAGDARERMLAAASVKVGRSWRDGLDGQRVAALRAALGEPDDRPKA
jgi:hypothetical protein